MTTTDMMTKTMTTIGKPAELEFTPDEVDNAAEDSEYDPLSHACMMELVQEFVDITSEARTLSERCRDYYDGKQWTDEQIKQLKRRKQAAIVNNRIKVKLNGLLGILALRKTDPKAYPRNVDADSNSAEAATDGLTYAADKTVIDSQFMRAGSNYFCEGYCGIQVIGKQNPRGEVDVVVEHIMWDRLFFDPYSMEPDFSDARGKGFLLWMDEEDLRLAFPDADDAAFSGVQLETDGTFEDKPSWFRKAGKRKRHLVATHYKMHKGVWMVAIYTGSGFLLPPTESPYLDEYGQPECPIEMEYAYMDREGNRYGEIASFLDLQDEINHRRSKALHTLSSRQTFGNRGAIKDVKKAKRELSKPDGHFEIGTGELNKDFGVMPTNDMAQGQFDMYQDAKAEMDAQSFNAQMAGERQQGDLSGIAFKRLQSAGMIELNVLFSNFSAFKLRVYRQMWNRIRQYWDKEKWVRVTDDEKKLRFVGFNVPLDMKTYLEDAMKDETLPHEVRLGASAKLIMLEQQDPQGLSQIIEVKNKPAELDLDIIIDESFDVINASEEQLDAILKFGAQSEFDVLDLLQLSNIRGKDKLIDKIENRRKEAAEAMANQPPDANSQYLAAKAGEAQASAAEKAAKTEHQQVETQILQQQPELPYKTNVSI